MSQEHYCKLFILVVANVCGIHFLVAAGNVNNELFIWALELVSGSRLITINLITCILTHLI